ncbi:MAG: DNA polymerase III subunit gamma/tau [Elusimicrobia bacterium]|nr:DNA polymerase III subunit gamma/tau [Elusimicrobiota bacterium]
MLERRPLTLKYRPAAFCDVVGQDAISKTLQNTVGSGRLFPAYLFYGPRGSGKTSMARIFARALNCFNRSSIGPVEPCGTCDPCVEIAEGRSIDVLEMDAASHTQVDNVREVILDTINLAPARDRYRIFIIDEVHMLSSASFNAMLKTLEEPPSHVVFILATTELHKVPATVASRTQSFPFRAFSVDEIVARLKFISQEEKILIADNAIEQIARAAGGSLRDGLSILEQLVSLAAGDQTRIEKEDLTGLLGFIEDAVVRDLIDALALNLDFRRAREILSEEFLRRGHSATQLLSSLLRGVSDDLNRVLDEPQLSGGHAGRLYQLSRHLVRLEGELRFAADPMLVCEVGLLGFLIENFPERVNQEGETPAAGKTQSAKPAEDGKNDGEEIQQNQDGLSQEEKFSKFLAKLKEAKLGLYLQGARLRPCEPADKGYEFMVANTFLLKGLENNCNKVLTVWMDIFGKIPLKLIQTDQPPSAVLTSNAAEEPAAASDSVAVGMTPGEPQPPPAEISDQIQKIAKVFGGKIKRIKRQ